MADDRWRRRSAYEAIEDPATLRRLLEATLLLESNLNLADLLSHIVAEARSLANARYGALGVLDPTGREVVEFLVSGLYPEDEARLLEGELPTGQGVLGVLIDDPRPIRIRVIADHPASVGFPPGHPPMTSFLGAPIKVRDHVYGNLYLTDKIGAEEFTADDEAVIEALAVAAGIAMENARLHQRAGEVAVYEDRDRMARDLHDGVIQRLFAIGLSLQGLARQARPTGRSAASIDAVIADIDETIRQVRATIFELGGAEVSGRGIRTDVLELAEEMRPVVGFDVPVEFAGAVDTVVSDADRRAAPPHAARGADQHRPPRRGHPRRRCPWWWPRTCRLEIPTTAAAWSAPRPPAAGTGSPTCAAGPSAWVDPSR